MDRIHVRALAASAAAILMLITAGCGSSGDSAASRTTSTSSDAAGPASTTGTAAAPIEGPNVSCTETMHRLRQMTAPEGRGNQMDCSLNGSAVAIQVVYHGEDVRRSLTPGITKIMWVVSGDDWYAYGPGGQAQAEAVAKELGGTVYNP
jgi:hypothetical protein